MHFRHQQKTASTRSTHPEPLLFVDFSHAPNSKTLYNFRFLCRVPGFKSALAAMSQATKRKHVVKEVLGDYITPSENQQIMKILGSNGNNLHEAMTETGERFLLSMPTKFRKNIWIKRGDFVIMDPIEEGDKVKGEISFILYRDHIQHLRKLGVWPKGFEDGASSKEREHAPQNESKEEEEGSSDSEDDSDLFVNTNRATVLYSESDEESEDEDEEDDNEEK